MPSKRFGFLMTFFFFVSAVLAGAQGRNTDIPPDIPEYFLQRYGHFVLKNEYKAIEKLDKKLKDLDKHHASDIEKAPFLTEREKLIKEFWDKRDIDPSTPENEFKAMVDERIDDIAEERYFSHPDTMGLLFRSNDGYHGAMAKVYLLHGNPDAISVMPQSNYFSDMMLWLYMDKERGSIRFAFLFYRRRNLGGYMLLNQDSYRMDPCQAVNEVMLMPTFSLQGCTEEILNALNQLQIAQTSDNTPGYVFAWALSNFSQDPSIMQGQALEPPLPATAAIQGLNSRVVGEAAPSVSGGKTFKPVLAECPMCNSMIPTYISLKDMNLSVAQKDLDWSVPEESKIKADLNLTVIIEFLGDKSAKPLIFDNNVTITGSKDFLDKNPAHNLKIPLGNKAELASVPAGNYRVYIYLKNNLTNKYTALMIEKFVKQ